MKYHKFDLDTELCKDCGLHRNEFVSTPGFLGCEIKCDCGATKAGFDSHTHWCSISEQKRKDAANGR